MSLAPAAAWRDVAAFCALAGGALALLLGLHSLAAPRVAAHALQAQREALGVVLPAGLHDNDAAADRIAVRAPRWLGAAEPLRVWRARRGDAPSALVLEAVAPDGYAAPIRLLIGVRADGRVSGVQVIAQQETPGLGDPLADPRHPWFEALRGRALGAPPAAQWTVARDGGSFDQLAGATQTPRAILHAVRRALAYVERHGAALHAAPAGAVLEHADGP
jgi:electron transport complex protein RnfG